MFLSVFLRRLYICLASLALLVLAGLWLVPREDISVHETRSPAFDLEISLLVPDQSSAADFGRPGWTLPGQSVR